MKKVFAGLLAAGLVTMGLLAGCGSAPAETASKEADALAGTFLYEKDTAYQFDGYGAGEMCIQADGKEYCYPYKYTIEKDTLKLDFVPEEVRDATYEFKLDGENLTLIAGEGTAGGTYQLQKK